MAQVQTNAPPRQVHRHDLHLIRLLIIPQVGKQVHRRFAMWEALCLRSGAGEGEPSKAQSLKSYSIQTPPRSRSLLLYSTHATTGDLLPFRQSSPNAAGRSEVNHTRTYFPGIFGQAALQLVPIRRRE